MDTNSNSNFSSGKEQARYAFIKVIDSTLQSLYQVWDKMGFDDCQKKSREDTALHHVRNLLEVMQKEEQDLMDKIAKTIEDFSGKLNQLCEDLTYPNVKLSSNLTMVQRERILRTKVEALTKEKSDRMARYSDLHERDEHVCQILSVTPYYIPSGTVPSLEQLKELDAHVNNMQAERKKRHTDFAELKSKISTLYQEMETDPDTSFARDILNEDDDTFTLSSFNMENLRHLHNELVEKNNLIKREVEDLWSRLRALWNRLETPDIDKEAFEMNKEGHGKRVIIAIKAEIEVCEQLKFQNIRKFIDGIRSELVTWWDKCFFSADQRNGFKLYTTEEFSEQLLEAHEKELENLRAFYNEHRDILEKLERREQLFKNMVVFEEKASDPNRFFNDRGGKLLQEEKARKKLMKDLPKVEEEVGYFIELWEKKNDKDFVVNGLRFPKYVEQQWEDFYLRREHQKQDRLKARAKQTQEEMLFGSKSVLTPGKRKIAAPATPLARTPLKARKQMPPPEHSHVSIKVEVALGKLNEIKTPNTTSRLPTNSRFQHSTMMQSPFSRQPLYTPKTQVNSSSKKRRSVRLMKKAATDRKANTSRRRSRDQFSHTTISSDNNTTSTLASTGSYNDFANYVTDSKTSSPHQSSQSDF